MENGKAVVAYIADYPTDKNEYLKFIIIQYKQNSFDEIANMKTEYTGIELLLLDGFNLVAKLNNVPSFCQHEIFNLARSSAIVNILAEHS